MKHRLPRSLSVLLACLLLAFAPRLFAAQFVIANGDGPGEGFNDTTPAAPVGGNTGTTLGEQRLKVFEEAGRIWGQVLNSDVPIVVAANFDVMSCDAFSAVLGGAGPVKLVANFTNAPKINTWYHIALANALAGEDSDPTHADIGATFNSAIDNNDSCLAGLNWYLGLDHNHGSDIDLLAVVLHEFAHGLGFSTFVDNSNGSWLAGIPDAYGRLIRDDSLGLLWTQMTAAQRSASAINSGNVVWSGAQVTAASGYLSAGTDGSGRVRLYAPNPVVQGSSISHFDTSASPSLLMEPYITPALDSSLDLTDELLADVGWVVSGGPVCGNGIKEAGEECDGPDLGGASCGDYSCGGGSLSCTAQCTLDSAACTDCGSIGCNSNGVCESGEDCTTCPADCISGDIAAAYCGNGTCEAGNGENCVNCPIDCAGQQSGRRRQRFCCGAPGGENNVGCNISQCGGPSACTTDPVPPGGTYCCGDSQCEGEESPLSCALDCGSCTPTQSTETSCSDGVDNDCDGAIDAADPDCLNSSCSSRERRRQCSDGVDNDCDGLVDAADPDCQ